MDAYCRRSSATYSGDVLCAMTIARNGSPRSNASKIDAHTSPVGRAAGRPRCALNTSAEFWSRARLRVIGSYRLRPRKSTLYLTFPASSSASNTAGVRPDKTMARFRCGHRRRSTGVSPTLKRIER